jgi:trimeric autotransporter adhesin
MSTKTTFKRIALVAVAALGLGVLSVAPSSATVSGVAITGATDGTSTNSADGYVSDSTTAATFTVSGLTDTGNETVTVTLVAKSAKAAAATNAFVYYVDSATSGLTRVDTAAGTTDAYVASVRPVGSALDTTTSIVPSGQFRLSRLTAGYVGAKFAIQLDSLSARTDGTYTWTVIAKGYTGVSGVTSTTADVSIVVGKAASSSTTIVPSSSTAWINTGTATNTSSDSAVAVVATAANTTHATINVITKNANGNEAPESVTATVTGPGQVCNEAGTTCGKNLTIAGDGSTAIGVRADGTAGTASIVIKTTTVTFAAKTVTFFAKAAKTITLAVAKPVIGVASATDVIRATATDADGNVWGGTAYIYADTAADALIAGSVTPAACTFNSARGYHECPLAGTAAGTANFKVIDASTVALATATSASAAVRVSTGTPTTAKIMFDKATYAPGEKAQVWVTATDAAGLALPAQTITNIFTSGGITSSTAFSTGSADLTSTSAVIEGASSSSTNKVAGYQVYIVYMPMSSGVVTLTATGSTGLALAGRVALSASAEVVNSSVDAATDAANEATDAANAATDAALAAADAADAATAAAQDASDAVAALSASVSKLISSLRAQITSLTNLVIKIQKKVRA